MENSGRAQWYLLLMPLLLFLPRVIWAENGAGVTLKVMVEQEIVVTSEKGKKEKRRVAATRIVPGDEVIYTIHYLNGGDKPAEDVFITIPIAKETTYVTNSARGAGTRITFSVDGGRHFADPDDLVIKLQGGRHRPATAADYTHVRWEFTKAVPAGASGAVSYRATLN